MTRDTPAPSSAAALRSASTRGMITPRSERPPAAAARSARACGGRPGAGPENGSRRCEGRGPLPGRSRARAAISPKACAGSAAALPLLPPVTMSKRRRRRGDGFAVAAAAAAVATAAAAARLAAVEVELPHEPVDPPPQLGPETEEKPRQARETLAASLGGRPAEESTAACSGEARNFDDGGGGGELFVAFAPLSASDGGDGDGDDERGSVWSAALPICSPRFRRGCCCLQLLPSSSSLSYFRRTRQSFCRRRCALGPCRGGRGGDADLGAFLGREENPFRSCCAAAVVAVERREEIGEERASDEEEEEEAPCPRRRSLGGGTAAVKEGRREEPAAPMPKPPSWARASPPSPSKNRRRGVGRGGVGGGGGAWEAGRPGGGCAPRRCSPAARLPPPTAAGGLAQDEEELIFLLLIFSVFFKFTSTEGEGPRATFPCPWALPVEGAAVARRLCVARGWSRERRSLASSASWSRWRSSKLAVHASQQIAAAVVPRFRPLLPCFPRPALLDQVEKEPERVLRELLLGQDALEQRERELFGEADEGVKAANARGGFVEGKLGERRWHARASSSTRHEGSMPRERKAKLESAKRAREGEPPGRPHATLSEMPERETLGRKNKQRAL